MVDTANVRNATIFIGRGVTGIVVITRHLGNARHVTSKPTLSVTMIMKAWNFVNGFVDHATDMPGAFIGSELCR
jgi:hypothetical protein